jgi:hypothetical protein
MRRATIVRVQASRTAALRSAHAAAASPVPYPCGCASRPRRALLKPHQSPDSSKRASLARAGQGDGARLSQPALLCAPRARLPRALRDCLAALQAECRLPRAPSPPPLPRIPAVQRLCALSLAPRSAPPSWNRALGLVGPPSARPCVLSAADVARGLQAQRLLELGQRVHEDEREDHVGRDADAVGGEACGRQRGRHSGL